MANTDDISIATATMDEVASATEALGRAFEHDPVSRFFFATSPRGVKTEAGELFSLLLRVRIALDAPRLVARREGRVVGAAMGNRPFPADWPAEYEDEWTRMEQRVEGFASRFGVYQALSERFRPSEPHHYLGVLGVAPSEQGSGIGGRLLDAFRDIGLSDGGSAGVYLETANPDSRRFYERRGYRCVGTGQLDSGPLWCMFLPF